MNGSAKRLMAVFVVTAMIASAMVIVFTDEQDSSAATNNNYFYNQLGEGYFARNLYTALNGLNPPNTNYNKPIEVDFTAADNDIIATEPGDDTEQKINSYVDREGAKAITAWQADDPTRNYYFRGYTIGFTYSGSTALKATFTCESFDTTTFSGDKSVTDTSLADWIAGADIAVGGTDYQTIKNIHDYVTGTLSYNYTHKDTEGESEYWIGTVRSVYTAFKDSGESRQEVVCEGYAKMFKALCDRFEIECLIVTGVAGSPGNQEPHMWNYVKYNDHWFVVDCTFDDTGGGPDEYLLVGTGKVDTTHVEGNMFTYPSLCANSVNGSGVIGGDPTHTVTFKVNGSTYKEKEVLSGRAVAIPEEPSLSFNENFIEWRLEGETETYDFSTPVSSDITLVAYIVDEPVFKLIYDSTGGSKIQNTVVLVAENTTKITNSVPIKEGFKFKEWNTSKDGKGISYKGGEDITLVGDCTLYAIWEDTSSVSFKIDNVVDKAAEFLSKETIPGVSNLLLTIGVITTVVSLLAVLAIARK